MSRLRKASVHYQPVLPALLPYAIVWGAACAVIGALDYIRPCSGMCAVYSSAEVYLVLLAATGLSIAIACAELIISR